MPILENLENAWDEDIQIIPIDELTLDEENLPI